MSVFTDYHKWLFDGDIKSPIPIEVAKAYILTPQYLISTFMTCGKFNLYLDEVFNNVNLFYIKKEELLLFIKKGVIDFSVKKNNLLYLPFSKKDKNFEVMHETFPCLKKDEVSILMDCLKDHPDKDDLYIAIGLEDDRKPMVLKSAKKNNSEDRSISNYLKRTFMIKKIVG